MVDSFDGQSTAPALSEVFSSLASVAARTLARACPEKESCTHSAVKSNLIN